MASNAYYITAGLPVAKNSGPSPTSQVNTAYITAGLPPVVLEEAPAGLSIPIAMRHYMQMMGAA